MSDEIKVYKDALQKAINKINELDGQIKKSNKEDIAIIGYNCRFPGGADCAEEFWNLLCDGYDAVKEIPKERFDVHKYYSEEQGVSGKMSTRYASLLGTDVRKFDYTHFEILPNEATSMDPQHKLLLEVSWEALEDAGLDIESLRGSKTGVYVGMDSLEYVRSEFFSGDVKDITQYSLTGISQHSAAGRLSYFYDFQGPAVMCNTACSSSLVALNQAVEGLRSNQCDMAIVGGVNMLLSPNSFIALSQIHSLSKDGRCRTFSKEADGFGRGEGCGVVVLKRLSDAKKENCSVAAIVKGVYVGQDGKSNGFFAPNGLAEERVIKEAMKQSYLGPNDIDYVEAHGTGTVLGDFIETQAVENAFKTKKDSLYMGSVKSNIGHLEAASGMASLIKVILALKYKKIPPSIHCNNLNPDLSSTKIKIVRELMDWEKHSEKRRAGIDAFGISGTLVHVIVEEAETEQEENSAKVPACLLTLSAKTKVQLQGMVKDMQQYLMGGEYNYEDICFTTNLIRSNQKYRFSLLSTSQDELKHRLEDAVKKEDYYDSLTGTKEKKDRKIAFMFTGQGSIYYNIAKQLYDNWTEFATALDECDELFFRELNISIKDAIYGEKKAELDKPIYSQSVIFSIQYSLTKIWDTLKIYPSIVMGHSIGEYAVACYAGVISLQDAVKMVAVRGSIIGSDYANGKMVSVLADYDTVMNTIQLSGVKDAYIAAVNAPKNVTLSGNKDDVDLVIKELQKNNRVFINDLGLFYPYHTDLLKRHDDEYQKAIANIKFSKPRITVISSKTGTIAELDTLGNTKYWAEQLTHPVNFQGAVNQAFIENVDTFIEIGGTGTLSGLVVQNNREDIFVTVPTLRSGVKDFEQLLESLGKLYNCGVSIDWNQYWINYKKKKVEIPNYGFCRKLAYNELKAEDKYVSSSVQDEGNNIMEQNNVLAIEQENTDLDNIKNQIKEIMHTLTSLDFADIQFDKVLFSFGFDSLMLVSLGKQINEKFKLDISLDLFFTTLNTLDKIAEFVLENYQGTVISESKGVEPVQEMYQINEEPPKVTSKSFSDMAKMPINISDSRSASIQDIFSKQLQLISDQNAILLQLLNKDDLEQDVKNVSQVRRAEHDISEVTEKTEVFSEKKSYYVPYKKLKLKEAEKLNGDQLSYVNEITHRYNTLTSTSKTDIQKYRNVYANARNSAGFRPLYKEMIYQIIVEEGHGSKIIDLDGNEFIDITMGFGVNFFGHAPKFVTNALESEIKNGLPLGPMGRLPGIVAKKISKLTGVERVFFCNSGTEADMFAVRIARAITGRNKIVVFSGAYHGTYDGVLGIAEGFGEQIRTKPVAPGITQNAVKDLILLNYNTEESLQYIGAHRDEIAGVLVETVQSRRPDVQPKEYLVKLREVTQKNGIALIFDEVITGFRIGAGGAQEHFGVTADIVTYGKVIGGGMPIGVVAGKAYFLDSVDGGMWRFGDESVPSCNENKTMVAGTFCHHPMAMSASNAVLDYIIANRDTLYPELNKKVERFIAKLNIVFMEEKVPFKAVNFGSLFRFYNVLGDYDIFYYGLVSKGIYVWEGRNCFISTEHSEEDLSRIIHAVRETIVEMKEAGYFEKQNEVEKQVSQFPMSLIQERLYTKIELSDSDPFDMVSAYILKEKLDLEHLERIINCIIDRHESLRTKLFITNGEFRQEVVSDWNFHIGEVETDKTNLQEVIASSIHPFDLQESMKIEVILIKTGNKKELLIFHFHHTVADGISMNEFVQEMIALYHGKELQPCKQYRDFVQWEKDYLQSKRLKEDEEYWLENLNMKEYCVSLPYDYRTSTATTYKGNTLIGKIGKRELNELNRITKESGVSTFMMMAAAVNLLMHYVSHQKEVAVVTPVSNRFHGGFDQTIGMFTNMVVLKATFEENESFIEYLEQVKKNCLNSYLHYDYPYNLLVNNLKKKSEHLFNINFVYEKTDERVFDSNIIDMEEVEYIPTTQEFEVTFELLEQNGEVKVCLRYQTELFAKENMQILLDKFLLLIGQIVDNSMIPVEDISLVSDEEKNRILTSFNSPQIESMASEDVLSLYLEQLTKNEENVAVRYKDKEITYKEFNQKASSLAFHLVKCGVKANEYVAIIADRSIEMLLSIYAVVISGGAYVPIDPEYPEERIQYILKDCQPKVILKQIKREINTTIPVIDVKDETLYQKVDAVVKVKPKANDAVYCIYTSGTTGVPKGVTIENKSLANYIEYGKKNYLEEIKCMPLFTNYCFDLTVTTIFLSLCSGGTLEIIVPEMESDIGSFISNDKYTFIKMTPAHLRMALQSSKIKKPSIIKHLILGGEALDIATTSEIMKRFGDKIRIHNEYGPTETTIGVCDYIYKMEDTHTNVLIGKPITNTQIYIMNDNKLCGVNEVGELCIAGIQVSRGYLNQPALTKEKFILNPFGEGKLYRSGDYARWLYNGELECLGRFDDQVKLRGFRIELDEIENVIREIEHIQDVCVVIQDDKHGEGSICAYVVSELEISFAHIREEAGKHLPDYMIPSLFMALPKIPLTRNGKVDRRVLPFIEVKSEREYEPPVTTEEIALCSVFEEVLGVNKAGVHDNFFELGGDSIKAIRIVSKMREQGYKVLVKDIMRYSILKTICLHMERNEEASYEQGSVSGEVLETPMLRIFREMQLSKPEHYNQAVMIRLEDVDEKSIMEAMNALVFHHDILRSVYKDNTLILQEPEEKSWYTYEVYSVEEDIDIAKDEIKRLTTSIQKNIHLENGPLVKTALFRMKEENLFFICIHHLLVDGVSWRILLEDFNTGYETAKKGEVIRLPEKTESFIEWSKELSEYRNSSKLMEERTYWDKVWSEVYQERFSEEKHVMEQGIENIGIRFSKDQTIELLINTNKAFLTELNELLLCALVRAVHSVTGKDAVSVGLEGHGREEPHKKVNIDRTVGWFTTMYPVIIHWYEDLKTCIVETKETLRHIPNHGLGYGLLHEKYSLEPINLYFNYMGEMQDGLGGTYSSLTGVSVSEENDMLGSININGIITDGQLQFLFEFKKDKIAKQTIADLSDCYKQELENIIAFCSEQKKTIKTLSDYDTKKLTSSEFEEIIGLFD